MPSINPDSFTDISTGSCTVSSEVRNTELVRIYEEDIFIVESYLNTPITILSNIGLKAKTLSREINIIVDSAGELVTSKLYSNGLSLKEIINSNVATPSISSVSDYILKGGGESAIEYAMIELADGATDWVLDPANNAIKYKSIGDDADLGYPSSEKLYGVALSSGAPYTFYPTAEIAATTLCSARGLPYKSNSNTIATCGNNNYTISPKLNPAYNPDAVPDADGYKSLPINVVAEKVIANAEAGHAPSQEAVNNSVII